MLETKIIFRPFPWNHQHNNSFVQRLFFFPHDTFDFTSLYITLFTVIHSHRRFDVSALDTHPLDWLGGAHI
jgi:hypothetical protein